MSGGRVPDALLAAEVPDLKGEVLVFDGLHVEADGCVNNWGY